MVGEKRWLVLEEILTESQINYIIQQSIGKETRWKFKNGEVKKMDGLAGYLGDHLKAVINVDVEGEEKKVHLFLKVVPTWNKPKAQFIDENNFYRREMLMFKILEEICEDGGRPWCVKAYIYTETILVMPDLALEGYSTRHYISTLDSEHMFLTTTSLAQFHAAFVNYETKKSLSLGRPYNTAEVYGDILEDTCFCDSPFLKTCSKLSVNLLKHLSDKAYRNMENLESILTKLYIKSCDLMTEYKDTINVLIHRDLWVNNIMFKYHNGAPINCVLIDFQCLRYGPPVFDLMMFLYLTTDRNYRQERENDILDHYYSIFIKNLSDDSKRRIEVLGYDKDNFLSWCEKARMFGIFGAIAIQPFTLMDPEVAAKSFNDPETYDKYILEDRSEPVLEHANNCEDYKRRNLEVVEEFVERYVMQYLDC